MRKINQKTKVKVKFNAPIAIKLNYNEYPITLPLGATIIDRKPDFSSNSIIAKAGEVHEIDWFTYQDLLARFPKDSILRKPRATGLTRVAIRTDPAQFLPDIKMPYFEIIEDLIMEDTIVENVADTAIS